MEPLDRAALAAQMTNTPLELETWSEAEVRVWYFSCTHDTLVLRLARGVDGKREFAFVWFLCCKRISIGSVGRLGTVKVTEEEDGQWSFHADKVSVNCLRFSIADPGPETLKEMARLNLPIYLDDGYSIK